MELSTEYTNAQQLTKWETRNLLWPHSCTASSLALPLSLSPLLIFQSCFFLFKPSIHGFRPLPPFSISVLALDFGINPAASVKINSNLFPLNWKMHLLGVNPVQYFSMCPQYSICWIFCSYIWHCRDRDAARCLSIACTWWFASDIIN